MNALILGQTIYWHDGSVSKGQMIRSRTVNGKRYFYAFTETFGHVVVFLLSKKKRRWAVRTDAVGNPEKLP